MEYDVSDISIYLFRNIDNTDPDCELPPIMNMPLKLVRNPMFN